jgi:hypothetical protein
MATPTIAMIPSAVKAGKLGSPLPLNGDGDLDFTRAGTKTRINESQQIETVATGVPSIDYTGGGCPSLLLEPQSTNLVTYSEDFSNAFWSKQSATVATSTIVSPDGLQGSYKLIPDNGTGGNRSIANSYTSLTGLHTHTCFAKKGEYDYLMLRTRNSPSAGVMFDLANGTLSVNLTSAVYVSSKIENYGNGWYRCSITLDPSQADTVGQLFISLSVGITGSEDNSFDGNGTSGVYIWGSQFENLSYPTSYIPTSGATVTRIADSASKTGLSSYINSSEGVLYAEISALIDGGNFELISLSDGSSLNRCSIFFNGGNLSVSYRIADANIFIHNESANLLNYHKIAISYKQSEFKMFIDGVKIQEQLSGNVLSANTFDRLTFDIGNGANSFYGKTKDLRVYNIVLTDTELTALTT